MTTTPPPTDDDPRGNSARPSTRRLLQIGVTSGVAAAVATAAIALLAGAGDVSLEVDGTAIPPLAFGWWSLVGAALGMALAWFLHDRRRFVSITSTATVLSLLPAIAAPDDSATKVVLVATHLVAAAIIIPALGRLLDSTTGSTAT